MSGNKVQKVPEKPESHALFKLEKKNNNRITKKKEAENVKEKKKLK